MADESLRLEIKVVPNSSRDAIVGWLGDHLKIRVQAPPEGGKANQRVLELLANKLRISISDIALIRGGTSQHKAVEIRGLTGDALRAKLAL